MKDTLRQRLLNRGLDPDQWGADYVRVAAGNDFLRTGWAADLETLLADAQEGDRIYAHAWLLGGNVTDDGTACLLGVVAELRAPFPNVAARHAKALERVERAERELESARQELMELQTFS